MAKISVHIEADNPADLHTALLELMAGTSVSDAAKTAKPKKAAAENKLNPAVVADPVTAAPVDDPFETPVAVSAPVADPAPPASEKMISHEDLRDAMQLLKSAVSRQLIAEFSGKAPEERPKLSDVPADKHSALLAEAKRLSQVPENVKQGAHE